MSSGTDLPSWLRRHATASNIDASVVQFLCAPPPYRGVHEYDQKELVKSCGLRWQQNPSYTGAKGDRRGWFVAPSVHELRTVLALDPRPSRPWTPVFMDTELEVRQAKRLVDEYCKVSDVAADTKLPPRGKPYYRTQCRECHELINQQFLECSCGALGKPCLWHWCSECDLAFNDAHPCDYCSSPL